jgi:hypothetical protein
MSMILKNIFLFIGEKQIKIINTWFFSQEKVKFALIKINYFRGINNGSTTE